ncbi:unnamed protein product [Aphanomyces euteiches]|uniref:CWH43-like N-terminal domain-containing protein n=1 Tax=Aphanomyces euteiches TaxID=100861 RepID=A0A6G0WW54_9STRA|nr:hypothetical protein Ae201684_011020 [Aphanomyces euteiches]KAH9058510.1 hypothetical protein Ae201684P_005853 [Aphanomyces euteiches]KAH9094824.1 hypothetical protein LEN26_018078 [Aphanomyces euteiches]KAH9112095.1 hypothetical protein AeMF1_013534 [Aphanomyces euteiches]KAH9145692.1 hypothetical protein AeRB84_010403 [Aphanomyces euteiches]
MRRKPARGDLVDGTSSLAPAKKTSAWVYIYPILVPVAGLITMASTIGYSCTHQFTCSQVYPTLSTAAKYHPQFYIFAVGMNTTSYAIFLAVSLYSTYLARTFTKPWQQILVTAYYVFGLLTCAGLSALATFDLRRWQTTHIVSTVFFFVSSWIMMLLGQISRWILQYSQPNDVVAHRNAVRWGTFWLGFGIFLTLCFGFCYLSVHGYIENVFGIPYLLEAMCELFSIVCQLLFMGTLSSEVGTLHDKVNYFCVFDAMVLGVLVASGFAIEYI